MRPQKSVHSQNHKTKKPQPNSIKMSESDNSIGRSFRLISVSFKEASLDSPSFRASLNHLDAQLSNLTNWANGLASSVNKVPNKINELRLVMNSFSEHLTPKFTDEGLIDQETTVPLLDSLSRTHMQLNEIFLNVMIVDPSIIRDLVTTVNSLYQKYHSHKRFYEATKEKYDQYFDIYMGSSKLKQSQLAIEDAVQLFKARKDYLHASLDIVNVLNEIAASIDSKFMNLSSTIWLNTMKKGAAINLANCFPESHEIVKRTQSWAIACERAMKSFVPDVVRAREQVEKTTVDLFEPSTSPIDYDASLINAHTLSDIDDPSFEKHGYLLMKTWSKHSNKPIWVKRWAFIKGGVFGMLVLSPSKTFVQETDKIGVLLISLRYAAQEIRRFCFELRTSDQVLTLQAESLIELKSWFKVFENEKSRILSTNKDSTAAKVASTRFPPSITEFASTIDTLVDKQMTNTRLKDEGGNILTSSNLSTRIKQNEQYFQKYLYHQIPSFKPPLITSNTKTAIIAYSFAASSSVPSALTANTWGSVNWGLYYLHKNLSSSELSYDQTFPTFNEGTDGLTTRDVYPHNFPHSMVSLDVEMRALFETEIQVGEICLHSFSCIWSPNRNQELFSRVFVTNKSLLLCNQAFGFRSLFKSDLLRLVDVETTAFDDHDELRLFLVNDYINSKVYLEKGELIKRKLKYLIDNKNKDQPSDTEAIIEGLVKIDRAFAVEEKARLNPVINPRKSVGLQQSNSISQVESPQKVPIYQQHNQLPFLVKKKYYVPAKAVFHVLLGEFSTILQTERFSPTGFLNKYYQQLPDGRLRNVFYSLRSSGGAEDTRKYKTSITIEQMEEDQYYYITSVRGYFTFYGSTLSSCVRVIIQAQNAGSCIVKYHSDLQFKTSKPINILNKFFLQKIVTNELKELEERVRNATKELGTNGQIGRAIFLYGKLPQGNASDTELAPCYCRLGFRVVIHSFVLKPMLRSACNLFSYFWWFMLLVLSYLKEITAQRLLLAIVMVSVTINVILTSRSTYSYWSARQSHQMAKRMFNSEPLMLQRAVYLKDTELLTQSPGGSSGRFSGPGSSDSDSSEQSICLEAFEKSSFIHNFESPISWKKEYIDSDTREVAIGLKKTFQEIGIKRHKLLMEFNILNRMEEEIAKGEYRNWLVSEARKCGLARSKNLAEALTAESDNMTEVAEGLNKLSVYCDSCVSELKRAST